MKSLPAILVIVATVFLLVPEAEASVFHVVRQGDTVTSIAVEYYGDPERAIIIRAVNHMPLEGEVELALGEPILVPQISRRRVQEEETWQTIALEEMGDSDRSWYLTKLNAPADGPTPAEDQPPPVGAIITIPYLMPLSLTEGLPATIIRFYPGLNTRERFEKVRLLKRINPGLRGRGMPRGARIVVPFPDLTIRPEKRAEVERRLSRHRSESDQNAQDRANEQLERLPGLLEEGNYAEVIMLAGQLSGSSELTEAQQVTLHRYLGQAFFALDRVDLAEREFTSLLRLQPDFQFDQVTTSPPVLECIERARRRLRESE